MKRGRWAYVVLSALLASCASTSAHYYTLVTEPERSTLRTAVPFRLEVERIPAQVDRSELVVRLPDGRMAIVDGERWIAPVGDELQNALSLELLGRLGTLTSSESMTPNSLSVRLNVERFEASPYRYALIEASWRLAVRAPGHGVSVLCRTRAYEQVTGGYPDLVRGYQRAVAALAAEIATVAEESMRGLPAECPGRT